MHLPLYKALRGANISDEVATALVQAMDDHVEARVNAANQPLMAQLKQTEAVMLGRIDALMAEKATAEKLAWFPLYGGNPATCGNPVEAQKYPSIYWACGNFTSMNILQSQSLCRWTYSPASGNEPMEVYIR